MEANLKSFFRNKKILITGHTGFKGCWLALFLQSIGANVKGFSLNAEEESFFQLIEMDSFIKEYYGNLNDYPVVENILTDFSPEIVFHLAAQAIVCDSYKDPINTYSTNIMGTVHLLEAVRKTPSVKVVINVTTDKCYENNEWAWKYRENDPLGGRDPYSSSKASSELVSVAYYHSYLHEARVKLGTARAGNVIGGGDFGKNRLIPDFIRAVEKNTSLNIRCPSAIRPWQHVLDCIYGYCQFAHYLWYKECNNVESYNFAPDNVNPVSVSDVLNHLSLYIKINKETNIVENQNFKENYYLMLDNSKAKKELNWTPIFDSFEAIQYTAEWYNTYLKKEDDLSSLLATTHQQLQHYLKRRGGK